MNRSVRPRPFQNVATDIVDEERNAINEQTYDIGKSDIAPSI